MRNMGIQAPGVKTEQERGVVRAVLVQEGQTVKAGQVLVELDPTESAAERDRFGSELVAARLDGARLRAALSTSADPAESLIVPEGASAEQAEYNWQLLTSQVGEQRAKLGALDRPGTVITRTVIAVIAVIAEVIGDIEVIAK